ncbi:MAG: ATP-binding protein [Armatimonadetes bacterium]|nr:ATP-binding protein [Armatimonadota bacterium]
MMAENSDTPYVPRVPDADIREYLDRAETHKPVLLVEGARQVGKTRLVEEALRGRAEHVVALNLERDALARSRIDRCREFAEFAELLRDDHAFTGAAGETLFIDEAQESLRLGGFVRFMKEDWPRASVVLSGSTLTRLFRPDQRYPVGRVERLVVRPFAFSEFLAAHGQDHLVAIVRDTEPEAISAQRHERLLDWFDRFLQTGGLPQVVLAHAAGRDPDPSLARLAADYEQDFLRLFGEDQLAVVQMCLRAVALLAGSAFKNTAVVPNASTSVSAQVSQILARLEAWHLVLRADQYGPSPEATHRHLPKRYLFDSGLLRHLRETAIPSVKLAESAPALRALLGGVLENQLALDLARQHQPLAGWKRSASGSEIDFVHRMPDGSELPVECKAALRADARHLRGLRAYLDQYAVETGVLASCAPYSETRFPDGKRILWWPLYLAERLSYNAAFTAASAAS